MMREQRGLHFDPVLLDAFLEVLGSSGPDAKVKRDVDPAELAEAAFERYTTAIERGDAEAAEGVFAQAIEDGIPPATLHADVFEPALARVAELVGRGEVAADTERLATGITKRILATMYRYTLGGSEPDRERVLVAGVEGEDRLLVLQMINDQLAAAGYDTVIDPDLSPERLESAVRNHTPELVVLAATRRSSIAELERMLNHLADRHPDIPVMLAGPVVDELPDGRSPATELQHLDQVAMLVQELLGARQHVLG
jgi:methanogenic corrinoid protein MtbC1